MKKGTPLWKALLFEQRLPLRYIRLLTRYRSYYLIKIKRYKKLNLNKNHINGIFDIFTKKNNGKIIVLKKIKIKGDSFYADRFIERIKDYKEYKNYYNTLMSLNKLPLLNKHTCKVKSIKRNGSYISPFIEGYNLKILSDRIKENKVILEKKENLKILYAMKEMIDSLENYQKKFGKVPGDWLLHNLIYSIKKEKIINIDLEGFYTYRGNKIKFDGKKFKELKKELIKNGKNN